jgi:hypothetical protein
MKVSNCCLIKMMTIIIVLAFNQVGSAQGEVIKGGVIESVKKVYSEDAFYEIFTENDVWDDTKLRIESFLNVDPKRLEETAIGVDSPPKVEKTKMYAAENRFRVDNESEDGGKLTLIYRKDLGMMYQINWNMMTVTEIPIEVSKQMANRSKEYSDVMQTGIDNALKSLPPDKQKEAMEALSALGQHEDSGTSNRGKTQVTKTGRKRDINRFSQCEEYRVTYGNKNIAVWATDAEPGLIKQMSQIGREFKSGSGMEDENEADPWELLPNKLPALTITYTENMMSGIEFAIEEILSAMETTFTEKTFNEFKNPNLREVSMMNMMRMD